MTDNIDVVVKESGTTQVVKSFDDVAAAAQRAHTSVSALQKLFGSVGRSTAAANRVTALGTAAQGAASHVNNLNSAMNALNNTRVTSNLNSANQALGTTATNAKTAATGVRDLLAAFISFNAIKGVISSLVEAQISMQQIHYGLLAATGSAKGAAEQFEYLRKNADTLGLDLKTSATEYTRLAASATAMNVAVEDQQKLYTALSQASTVLHLDQQKVQFATLALTQMFSKGKIQAEELRRQLGEAIPGVVPRFQKGVMEMVKGTDLAKYSFEELMKRGLLDTAKFLPELVKALEETGRGWQDASKGLNAELNRLKTSWFELKVSLSEGLFNDAMIAIVRFLSSNLKELTGIVAGLGVAISVMLAPAAIIKFIGYIKELGVAIYAAAGPWGLVAAAIAGVITYLVTMRDEIKLGIDDTTTLGDLMRAVWEQVLPVIKTVADAIGQFFSWWLNLNATTFTQLLDSLNGYEHANESMWLKIVRAVAIATDAVLGLLIGLFDASQRVFGAIAGLVTTVFGNAIKGLKAIASGDLDAAADVVKNNVSAFKNAGKLIGSALGDGLDTGFGAMMEGGLESKLDAAIKRAQEIGKERTRAAAAGGGPTAPGGASPGGGGDDSAAKKAAKELERLKDALSRVLGEINPTMEAQRKLAEAQETLNKAVDKGLISQEKADWVMSRLRDKYKDVLDPVGALLDKYKEEREVLKYVGDEQQIQAEVLTKVRDLKKKNYEITDQQVQAIRAEVEALKEATRMNQAYNQVLNQTVYAQRTRLEQIKAIGDQKALGESTGGKEGISGGQAAQQAVDVFGEDRMAGTAEYYAAQLQTYNDFLAQIDAARTEGIISEQTANALSLQAWNDLQTAKLASVQGFLGSMTGLMSSNNKTAFKIGQAAAIAETSINTYKAATAAYSAMAGIPYVGPILGVAAAAAAVAAGIANISKIRAQQPPSFRTGGSMVVGGAGGTDSQLVQFNATPGEQVNINTPSQARAMERLATLAEEGLSNRGNFNQNVTIVQQGTPNRRTADQQARAVRKQTQMEYERNQ